MITLRLPSTLWCGLSVIISSKLITNKAKSLSGKWTRLRSCWKEWSKVSQILCCKTSIRLRSTCRVRANSTFWLPKSNECPQSPSTSTTFSSWSSSTQAMSKTSICTKIHEISSLILTKLAFWLRTKATVHRCLYWATSSRFLWAAASPRNQQVNTLMYLLTRQNPLWAQK